MNIINNRVNINLSDPSVQNAAGHSGGITPENEVSVSTPNSADELMSQLQEDRNAVNERTNSTMISQALKAAGLPETPKNTAIVNSLLENNMSIGRDSLRSTLLLTNSYPNTDISTLVTMIKAGIPVNSESISTLNSFFDGSQILIGDVNAIADMVENVLSNPSTPASVADALRQAVYDIVSQNANVQNTPAASNSANGTVAQSELLSSGAISAEVQSASASNLSGLTAAVPSITAEQTPSNIIVETARPALPEEAATEEGGDTFQNTFSSTAGGSEDALSGTGSGQNSPAGTLQSDNTAAGTGLNNITPAEAVSGAENTVSPEGQTTPADNADLSGRNDYSFRTFEELTAAEEASPTSNNGTPDSAVSGNTAVNQNNVNGSVANTAGNLGTVSNSGEAGTLSAGIPNGLTEAPSELKIAGKALSELTPAELKDLLKGSLSLNPKDISRESIKALYERTNSFFNRVKEATAHAASGSALHTKAAQALKDSAILHNLNRLYPHIELPLKLENANAEGSLYVYTNRNGHISKEGHATALLHLDMPSLGLVDIHLDLKDSNLGLNFYTEDASGKLLAGDLTSLRDALTQKGYSVSAHFHKHDEAGPAMPDGINDGDAAPRDLPERLSFDIKA